ncbi:MAG: sulfide/dihydroorotate dehydrogenase-like FAD/NAD-binding protein [Candidatus Omnitrophota bacterium]|jgi:ferredoxin--NADP+ reductase
MKILEKQILSDDRGTRVIRMKIFSKDIPLKAKAGQFIVLMANEYGERIPLTIVDKGEQDITIIFQEAGLTTKLLGKLNVGDSLYALVGPLGHPTEIENYGKVILVAGGVGIAEIYPVAKSMREAGNRVVIVLGARTKGLLILENELKNVSDEFYITTDDGSYVRKGFTTDILAELLKKDKYDLVYAVGPIPMMQKVAQVAQDFKVKTVVSLNALMVDGTGMCGCCRVSVAGQTKFSCVDGPEFDAAQLNWEELAKRNKIYSEQEKHICRLNIK